MDPINRILQQYPTIIPCSDVMQVKWKINDDWFCASPKMHKCEPPFTLKPLAPSAMEIDFTTGMGRGIYTQDQLSAHRRYDAQLSARAPALAGLANNAAEHSANGKMGSYLGQADLDAIEEAVTPKLMPLISVMGDVWHYLTGLGVLWVISKIIFGFCVRIYGLYNRRGWGWWLLGAVTDTTFMIAAFPVTIMTSIFRFASTDDDIKKHNDDNNTRDQNNEAEIARNHAPTAPLSANNATSVPSNDGGRPLTRRRTSEEEAVHLGVEGNLRSVARQLTGGFFTNRFPPSS